MPDLIGRCIECSAQKHASCVVVVGLSKAPCSCHSAGHAKPGEKTRVIKRRHL